MLVDFNADKLCYYDDHDHVRLRNTSLFNYSCGK